MAVKFGSVNRRNSGWSGKSFTLIELLIVIAIIAILAAMLLPALNKARDSAKNIDCIARTKQLMLAMTSYTDDNGNFLPYISGNGAGDSSQLAYSGGTIPNLLGKYLAAQSNESREKKAAVWECPRLPYTRTNGVNRDFFCGKWLNGCLFTDRSGTRGRKLVNIKTPSAKILFMDTLDTVTGNYDYNLYFRPSRTGYGGSFSVTRTGAHQPGNGAAFLDGHAEAILQHYWMNGTMTSVNLTAFNAHEEYQPGASGNIPL